MLSNFLVLIIPLICFWLLGGFSSLACWLWQLVEWERSFFPLADYLLGLGSLSCLVTVSSARRKPRWTHSSKQPVPDEHQHVKLSEPAKDCPFPPCPTYPGPCVSSIHNIDCPLVPFRLSGWGVGGARPLKASFESLRTPFRTDNVRQMQPFENMQACKCWLHPILPRVSHKQKLILVSFSCQKELCCFCSVKDK